MAILNKQAVKKQIKYYEKHISTLRRLLEIIPLLKKAKPVPKRMLNALAAAGRKGRRGAGGGVRRRRGEVSSAVVEAITAAGRPLTAGEIKTALTKKNASPQGASAIYSILLQMTKRGLVRKKETAEGNIYSLVKSGGKKK
ncbi:MAG: hypothetical protein HY804_10930 [Nitrospinae bacterium]|nr:hypothetical protein [Nitrospinota bacterium]